MGGNLNNLNQQHVGDNPVNYTPLEAEPGRTVVLPLAGQGFIVKPLDGAQSRRPRNSGNILPLFVALQNLDRDRAGKLLIDATVFFDLPHGTLCIYQ